MNRFLRILSTPGARKVIEVAAPTQRVVIETDANDIGEPEKGAVASAEANVKTDTISAPAQAYILDRWLDKVVQWSGSQFCFFFIITALLVWAFLGITFSEFSDWQVGISDGQAIINLVFDSFLMRQQLNSYRRSLNVLGVLKSRTVSVKRMLRDTVKKERCYRAATNDPEKKFGAVPNSVISVESRGTNGERAAGNEPLSVPQNESCKLPQGQHEDFAASLPPESLFGRICTTVSNAMGHLATVCIFWTGILIWLAFGSHDDWSSTWLLYINSATSALMVFVLAFLANIRERHTEYSSRCLDAIWRIDARLEATLRIVTGDSTQNPTVAVPPPKVGKIQRVIDYYADLVGALIGIVILIITMVVWIAIGPVMRFSSNWWLLIGTYAGLVGMNDGFVLRNVFYKLAEHENALFNVMMWEDEETLEFLAGLQVPLSRPQPAIPPSQSSSSLLSSPTIPQHQRRDATPSDSPQPERKSLTERVSLRLGTICSHEYTVILGFFTIVGLVVGATAMGWSMTGQLLCNVPPSIIESFFMLILITGHNLGDQKRREDLALIHARRLNMLNQAEGLVRREA